MYLVRDPPKLKKIREDFQLIHKGIEIKIDEHTDSHTWSLTPKSLHALNRFMWSDSDMKEEDESPRSRGVNWT